MATTKMSGRRQYTLIIRGIFGRLHEGVKVLHEIKSDTGKIGETNKEVLKVLKGISDKL